MLDDYNTATEVDSSGEARPEWPSGIATPTLPLTALLESLLFVADGPVPSTQFAAALEVTPRAIESALEELEAAYLERGLRIQRDKSGVQLTTAPQAAEAVEKFLGLESLQRLSRPAVETLAIIAYQQPVTRPHIESVRGVNCDGVIKSLLTKGLIDEVGRTEGPGRPVLYATTSTFLQHFGLTSLTDLPPLDIESLLAAAQAADKAAGVATLVEETVADDAAGTDTPVPEPAVVKAPGQEPVVSALTDDPAQVERPVSEVTDGLQAGGAALDDIPAPPREAEDLPSPAPETAAAEDDDEDWEDDNDDDDDEEADDDDD